MHQRTGTAYYIAPEVLKKKYNEKCDLWACGVILYIILCGYPPFEGPTEKAIMEKISEGKYSLEGQDWDEISKSAKNFIGKLLTFDPAKRFLSFKTSMNKFFKL
jgi:calcium-dependent protein kinase